MLPRQSPSGAAARPLSATISADSHSIVPRARLRCILRCSEQRLFEILDGICNSNSECNAALEQVEEAIEAWWPER